ncbi:MAG: hypothetical protein QG672_406 [Pseudomonadota bacterium]|nr:hypothetical protein [Pseudomonadota bacterium]
MSLTTDSNTDTSGAPEDAFFVLRDTRTLFQKRMTEVAREAGVATPSVLDAFTQALGEAHDELTSAQREGFEAADGLTASRMTLMCDADLEMDIRIGDIARRLSELCGSALRQVQLRYMTLLRRQEMSPANNPVGPEALSSGLWAICQSNDVGLERNMQLLGRLEEQFSAHLPAIYAELNELLTSRNIAPAQIVNISSGGTRSGSAAQSAGNGRSDGNANAFSALQQALNTQFGGTGNVAGGMTNTSSQSGNSGGNVALNAATLVMLNQLTTRLEQLQLSSNATQAASSDHEAPPRALKAADIDLPLGNPESVALETLGHIFEAIFNIWDLPDTVKTAISRLQIPLLKLSICDPSLFSDEAHPARRLINAMGQATLGLPRDISRAHPVSARLWQIASTVSETLQGDPGVLSAPLAELDTLITERNAALRETAQPFVALLQARENRAETVRASEKWLRDTEQQGSAQEILDFLRQYWVRVMSASALEGGTEGPSWQENHDTIVDLMWSVQPKPGADDRKRLAGLVPTLIRRINAGLDRIGVSQAERAPFLDACFNLQTASLRGNPPPLVTPSGNQETAATDSSAADLVDTETSGDIRVKIVSGPGRQTAAYRSAANNMQVGQWLQFIEDGIEPQCGLVVWISPRTGTTLLYGIDWKHAVALASDVLERQLREGDASIVSSRAIFDMAAERALSQIAKNSP